MIPVIRSKISMHVSPPPISRWVIGSFITTIVLIYTTFSNVIEVPIVSSYVGGTIFEVTRYISGLSTLYSPWLSKMMAESAGTSTAQLLRVGSLALVILEVIAIAAIVSLILHFILSLKRKTKPARTFGILGFTLALAVPVLMFAVVRFVGWQMTNTLIALNVLSVPSGPRIQMVAAILGCACVLLAARSRAEVK
jgi:hypothetical protein